MRIAPAPRSCRTDLWMVRVAASTSTGPLSGEAGRYAAIDIDPSDDTPGVYPMLFEQGVLTRPGHRFRCLR